MFCFIISESLKRTKNSSMSFDSSFCRSPRHTPSPPTAVLRQRFLHRQVHIAQSGPTTLAPPSSPVSSPRSPRFSRPNNNNNNSSSNNNNNSSSVICPTRLGRQVRAMTSAFKRFPSLQQQGTASDQEDITEQNFRIHPPSLKQLRLQAKPDFSSLGSLGSTDHDSSFDSVFDSDSVTPKPRICRSVTMSTSSCRSTPLMSRRPRLASLNRSSESTDSSNSSRSSREGSNLKDAKSNYRILVLGSKRVGKTCVIRQFLYDKFSAVYTETMDDMYRGEFEIQGRPVSFDIQDVSGSYVYEFPAMKNVSLASADAFIIVFSLDSYESWEEVSRLRDMVHEAKDPDVPIVVVGNKSDLPFDDAIPQESIEATVVFDWENGYVECSAKERVNINKIFKELLQQAKSRYDFTTHYTNGSCASPISIVGSFSRHGSQKATLKSEFEEHMRRRQSLPAAPPDLPQPILTSVPKRERSFKSMKSRRASLAALRRDSCKVS